MEINNRHALYLQNTFQLHSQGLHVFSFGTLLPFGFENLSLNEKIPSEVEFYHLTSTDLKPLVSNRGECLKSIKYTKSIRIWV